MVVQLPLDTVVLANQYYADPEFTRRLNGGFDLCHRRMVTAHCVNGDLNQHNGGVRLGEARDFQTGQSVSLLRRLHYSATSITWRPS